MKKLMKKIKSNKFIPKLVATLTICMVLLSSLSVSAFAADDEVSAANEETEYITDVWTSVMNWITSSLYSAQGVFVAPSGFTNSIVLDSFDLVERVDGDGVIYLMELPNMDISNAVPGEIYTFEFLNQSFALTFYEYSALGMYAFSDGSSGFAFGYYTDPEVVPPGFQTNIWYLSVAEPFSESTTLTSPFPFEALGSLSLTFLGTLAVIVVAIAIAFLLISVISRFLRLRG